MWYKNNAGTPCASPELVLGMISGDISTLQRKVVMPQKDKQMSEERAGQIALDLYIAEYLAGKGFSYELSKYQDEIAEKAEKWSVDPIKAYQFILEVGLAANLKGVRGDVVEIRFSSEKKLTEAEKCELALKIQISRGTSTAPDDLRKRVKRISDLVNITLEEAEDFVVQYQIVMSIGRASQCSETSLYRKGSRISEVIDK